MTKSRRNKPKSKKQPALVPDRPTDLFKHQRSLAQKWQTLYFDLVENFSFGTRRDFGQEGIDIHRRIRKPTTPGRLPHVETAPFYAVLTGERGTEDDLVRLRFWLQPIENNLQWKDWVVGDEKIKSLYGKMEKLVSVVKNKNPLTVLDYEQIPVEAKMLEDQRREIMETASRRVLLDTSPGNSCPPPPTISSFEDSARKLEINVLGVFPEELTTFLLSLADAQDQQERPELSPSINAFARFYFDRISKLSIRVEAEVNDGEYCRPEVKLTRQIKKTLSAFRQVLRWLINSEYKVEILPGNPDLQVNLDDKAVRADLLKRGLLILALFEKAGEPLCFTPMEFVREGLYSESNPTAQVDQFLDALSDTCPFVEVRKPTGKREIKGLIFHIQPSCSDLRAQIKTLADSRARDNVQDADIPEETWRKSSASSATRA